MARRMFSPDIVESDAFLEMPTSSQALYFHLGMYADDDGFVNPKKIMRMMGAGEDDLKVIIAKKFVLPFENGVVVIKHWRVNNLVRKDWYKETQYVEQKASLYLKENGIYTLDSKQGEPLVNALLTKPTHRLGKDRLGKDTNTGESETRSEEASSKMKYEIIDVELSKYLLELIRENVPTFKEPNIEQWAEQVRLMRERDKRTEEQIRFLIKWAQDSEFWKANILSTRKLREKFDMLTAQAKRSARPVQTGRGMV